MHFSINYIVSVPPFWICLYWCVTSRWHERNATTSHCFSRKSGKKYIFHAHPYQAWYPSCSQVPKFVFSYLFAWQHNTRSPETIKHAFKHTQTRTHLYREPCRQTDTHTHTHILCREPHLCREPCSQTARQTNIHAHKWGYGCSLVNILLESVKITQH